MEGGDNVGANNDVGGGASSGAAADPSTPSDGAAAAASGGVVDNSSPVVEDGGNSLTATTLTVQSENGTPVTVKIVKTAAGNRAKRSWIWQVMQEFKPSINGKNVICSACKHLMSWVSTSGTTGMTQHYGKKHPALYAQIMKKHTTPANAKTNVSVAIGKLIVVYLVLFAGAVTVVSLSLSLIMFFRRVLLLLCSKLMFSVLFYLFIVPLLSRGENEKTKKRKKEEQNKVPHLW